MQQADTDRFPDSISTGSIRLIPKGDVLQVITHAPLKGLWRSQGGSLYICDGQSFTCLSVHSSKFKGWVGKIAVRDIQHLDDSWYGWQAFRNMHTGELQSWQRLSLSFTADVVTKFFNASSGSGYLVYGPVEKYYRVTVQ